MELILRIKFTLHDIIADHGHFATTRLFFFFFCLAQLRLSSLPILLPSFQFIFHHFTIVFNFDSVSSFFQFSSSCLFPSVVLIFPQSLLTSFLTQNRFAFSIQTIFFILPFSFLLSLPNYVCTLHSVFSSHILFYPLIRDILSCLVFSFPVLSCPVLSCPPLLLTHT